jgi:hypothetical protein
LNQNNAKKNKALRLAFKPNELEQRTSTSANATATGQPVGTEQARAPRPMAKVGQNETTKMPLTKYRVEVHAIGG